MRQMIAVLMVSAALVAATPGVAQDNDRAGETSAVTELLGRYRAAIERLDASGTEAMFATDSQIFENGGVEGSYSNYLARHLGPELGHFTSFRFSDVAVDVRFEGEVALATETYNYRIERHEGAPIERRGVTTSVLRRTPAGWQVVSMHGSSRAPRPARPAG
ncbi:MAG: YybH family protein [Sphingosinicella sp.]|uniref:YybH family protein n=1 Tax=Sphingosinicella sp. TaxID=1917971 RepID=UPI004037B099